MHQYFFPLYHKKTLPFRWGGGVIEFIISCLLTLQMLSTKYGKDWPSSS